MTIKSFIGEKGSGKTLSMTIEAYKKYKQGHKIYSNYHLNFPHTIITVNDLIDFAESGMYFGETTFCLDELHLWFNARRSGKQRNICFNFFLTQSSKNDCDVLYSTQYSRQVDILIRINSEIVCKSLAKCVVWKTKDSKPIMKYNYRPKKTDYKCLSYINNTIIKFEEDRDVIVHQKFLGNKYFKLYNTREVIKQQQDVFEIAKKQNPKENKGVIKEKISYKQKREEQHNNRLFHEQNEAKLRGELS